MIKFLDEANNIKEEIISIRRDIHKHPELGFQEERTSKLIKNFLYKEGISFKQTAKTGVCAVIEGEKKGNENKVIALRADMDALPIEDKKNTSYSSKFKGKMHACGHDAHVAILLGVSKILNKYKKDFSGVIKLIFEPAEETIGGAPLIIEEGALENPKVDFMVGLHVNETLETGKIMVKSGSVNAASNPFKVKIIGKGGHGATPDMTVDPIVVASLIVTELQTIVSREVHPGRPVVLTVGTFNSGTAQNIIPDEAFISGIIRTVTPEDRVLVVDRFKKIVNGICKIHNAKSEITIEEGYPSLINDDNVVNRVLRSAKEVVGSENITRQIEPSMGVESFAYFAKNIPSAFYYLGTKNILKKTYEPAHGNYFDIDEDAIPLGIAIQSIIAYEYLTSN